MNYKLVLKPSAEKQLHRLSNPLKRRIIEKLSHVQTNPRLAGATKLSGGGVT